MKLAVKRDKNIVEIYTNWSHGYLNVYVKTNTPFFNYDTCFNGTSVNEAFLICSSTSNFFTTIFEPNSTSESIIQRTNFDLRMSYGIVTKGHGGELHLNSAENEGSVFTVTLPTNNL